MKRSLHKPNKNVTVVIDVSFTEEIEIIKEYIINEQCPVIYSLNDDGIIRFEWYLNCLLYTSPSPRDMRRSRMPSSA